MWVWFYFFSVCLIWRQEKSTPWPWTLASKLGKYCLVLFSSHLIPSLVNIQNALRRMRIEAKFIAHKSCCELSLLVQCMLCIRYILEIVHLKTYTQWIWLSLSITAITLKTFIKSTRDSWIIDYQILFHEKKFKNSTTRTLKIVMKSMNNKFMNSKLPKQTKQA